MLSDSAGYRIAMAKPMQIGSLSSKKIKLAIPIIGSLHTNGSTAVVHTLAQSQSKSSPELVSRNVDIAVDVLADYAKPYNEKIRESQGFLNAPLHLEYSATTQSPKCSAVLSISISMRRSRSNIQNPQPDPLNLLLTLEFLQPDKDLT
ncbi:hypothetical protein KQX54_004186 [Cotesia glomerata]|uniref:Uncharacterized protein n=1 Tax=Cotesia glomerata TaxID=32391 RepID=A0AAV7J509_COTGL|nr:hypothetical protein KQX54_004186 [Cotesia glomerata]